MRTCSVRFRLHVPFTKGRVRGEVCFVEAWEIPLRKPAGNRTPCGEARYGVENARGVHVFFVGEQTQNVGAGGEGRNTNSMETLSRPRRFLQMKHRRPREELPLFSKEPVANKPPTRAVVTKSGLKMRARHVHSEPSQRPRPHVLKVASPG